MMPCKRKCGTTRLVLIVCTGYPAEKLIEHRLVLSIMALYSLSVPPVFDQHYNGEREINDDRDISMMN